MRDVLLFHPRRDRREAALRFALHCEAIVRLSLLRILYHSCHVPQTLLQRLRELHRTGPAFAVKRRNREDEAVLPNVVGTPVAVWYHRPVSGDHVILRGHLRDKSYLHFKRHAVSDTAKMYSCPIYDGSTMAGSPPLLS